MFIMESQLEISNIHDGGSQQSERTQNLRFVHGISCAGSFTEGMFQLPITVNVSMYVNILQASSPRRVIGLATFSETEPPSACTYS